MLSSARPLFLAGLLLAAACSDAGTPVAAGDRDAARPQPASTVLQAVACTVDEVAGRASCTPVSAQTGNALGAINIGGGSSYVVLATSNHVATADSSRFDVTVQNVMNGQVMGTTDGVTAHPYGMRVFFYNAQTPTQSQPRVLTKVNPADTAWIAVVTPDSQVFSGAGSKKRPYFQHAPEILHPQDTSAPTTWRFALYNVATWSFVAYISTEVRFPKGWIDVTPASPVVGLGGADTLAAHVRGAFGQRFAEPQGLTWTSSNPSVVTVMELAAPDTLAQITAVSPGTAWIRARSSAPADSLARRDSVLVTVP